MTITFSADGKDSIQLLHCHITLVVGEFDIHGPREEIEFLKKWLEDYPIKGLVIDDNLIDELECYTLTVDFALIANDTPINILMS